MPPAPAQHYRETYRQTDLEKLIGDVGIAEEHREGLGSFLEDIAAIWRWKSSGELSVQAPATTAAEIRGIAKKAGSLKQALEGLSDQAFSELNVAHMSPMEREAFADDVATEDQLGLVGLTDHDTAETVYPDLKEITKLVKALEQIALDVRPASVGWKGPRKSAALRVWIGNIANFWTETLGRDFTRDVSDTGEPVSPAAIFCVAAFARLSPATPMQTVLNAMKAHIAAANKK